MVNYAPVVQGIQGKVTEPEYVDTRLNLDLSGLKNIAQVATGGMVSSAEAEYDYYKTQQKMMQDALKEQRAAEKHEWAREKHQFAINAESRAQEKYERDLRYEEGASQLSGEFENLKRMKIQLGDSMSPAQYAMMISSLTDKYVSNKMLPAGEAVKLSNAHFGNVSSSLLKQQMEFDKEEKEYNIQQAINYFDGMEGSEFMTQQEKVKEWNRNRALYSNLTNLVDEQLQLQEQGVSSPLISEQEKTTLNNITDISMLNAAKKIAYQYNGEIPVDKLNEAKAVLRDDAIRSLITATKGTMSPQELGRIVDNSLKFLDYRINTLDSYLKAKAGDSDTFLRLTNSAYNLVNSIAGKETTMRAIAGTDPFTLNVLDTLYNHTTPVSNNTPTTLPNTGRTVSTSGASMIQGSSPEALAVFGQIAPAVINNPLASPQEAGKTNSGMLASMSNIVASTASTVWGLVKGAAKAFTLDNEKLQKFDEGLKNQKQGVLLDNSRIVGAALDNSEGKINQLPIEDRRNLYSQIEDVSFGLLRNTLFDLSDTGRQNQVVLYDRKNNRFVFKQLDGEGWGKSLLNTITNPFIFSGMDDLNNWLIRLKRFAPDEASFNKAILELTESNGIADYNPNTDSIETPNQLSKSAEQVGGWFGLVPATLKHVGQSAKVVAEYGITGTVSEATKLGYEITSKDLENAARNFIENAGDLGEAIVDVGYGIYHIGEGIGMYLTQPDWMFGGTEEKKKLSESGKRFFSDIKNFLNKRSKDWDKQLEEANKNNEVAKAITSVIGKHQDEDKPSEEFWEDARKAYDTTLSAISTWDKTKQFFKDLFNLNKEARKEAEKSIEITPPVVEPTPEQAEERLATINQAAEEDSAFVPGSREWLQERGITPPSILPSEISNEEDRRMIAEGLSQDNEYVDDDTLKRIYNNLSEANRKKFIEDATYEGIDADEVIKEVESNKKTLKDTNRSWIERWIKQNIPDLWEQGLHPFYRYTEEAKEKRRKYEESKRKQKK